MNVFVFQADLLCEPCGIQKRERLVPPADPTDESSYDSSFFPKGPYPADAADSPQHCAVCEVFLENPLTDDGYAYTEEVINRPSASDPDNFTSRVAAIYREFYGFVQTSPKQTWIHPEHRDAMELKAIEIARDQYTTSSECDQEIDDNPQTSVGDDGIWVAGWFFVGNRDLGLICPNCDDEIGNAENKDGWCDACAGIDFIVAVVKEGENA